MAQNRKRNEAEQRIRAAVRTVMSPGVWLAIAVQLPTGLLIYWVMGMLLSEEPPQGQLRVFTLLLALLFLAYLFLMSGASRSFALGAATVSVQEAIRRGREVFNAFLWFAMKVFLLGMVASSVMLYFLGMAVQLTGVNTQGEAQGILVSAIKGIALIIPFALIYWLPVIFVRNDFRVIPTVGWALKILWRQLPRSGFLALLIFVPLLVLWLMPAGTPFILTLIITLVGQLMAWTAYVYCVEVLADNPSWLMP
jgi:hypothetical protein